MEEALLSLNHAEARALARDRQSAVSKSNSII